LNIETQNVRPISNSIAGITQLDLSPDDSKLLFTVQINGGYDIYMIRFPFERNLDMDELPLTKLKQKEKESIALLESFEEDSKTANSQIQGWGNFAFEFDQQQVVKENPDIKSNAFAQSNDTMITDYSEFVENDYKIIFSPDIVLANPGYSTYYGFQGVTQILYSDIMGNHQLFFQANLHTDLRNSQFMAAYSYLPKIIDYNFTIFHSAAYLYTNPTEESNDLYRFRNYGLGVTASYPFDLFNRLEWGINWLNVTKENMQNPSNNNLSRMLFVPQGRFVHDDVLWGYFAPHSGSRYYLGFKGTPKLGNENIGFINFDFDYRRYLPIGDYFSLALRGAAGASFGPDPQRYFVGGVDNWINRNFTNNRLPFDKPEDFAFSQFVLPVRGWNLSQIYGNKYFVSNVEFRFPMFQALVAGPMPILLQGVMGSFFFDVGAAWDDNLVVSRLHRDGKRYFENVIMSSGIGVRAYLLGLPVKMDVAWRNEYHSWSKPLYLFSLGFDF
jgi:outer membrane protein assembly factor BamA